MGTTYDVTMQSFPLRPKRREGLEFLLLLPEDIDVSARMFDYGKAKALVESYFADFDFFFLPVIPWMNAPHKVRARARLSILLCRYVDTHNLRSPPCPSLQRLESEADQTLDLDQVPPR